MTRLHGRMAVTPFGPPAQALYSENALAVGRWVCYTPPEMSLVEEARTVRQRIAARLRELEPAVKEYNELRKLAAEMGIDEPVPTKPAARTPAPAVEPAAAKPAAASPPAATPIEAAEPTEPRRRGPASRSRRAATTPSRARQQQATSAEDDPDVSALVLEAVRADPGKTVADYAKVLDVAPTALYRPVRELTNDGELVKRARQLFPA